MSEADYVSQNIDLAWKRFITDGYIRNRVVRSEIAQSWQRCRAAGVDPYSGVSHLILSEEQLNRLVIKKSNLIEIARLFMSNLYHFVEGSGFIVLLSDERGYIMEAIGDSDTMAYAAQLNLNRGASWAEEEVGTNGIGTALAIDKPIQVSGAEHYCQKVHFWTCSAAPIYDNGGQLVGVLQMSGPSSKTHQHTLGMVVAAVEAIRNQLKIQQRNRELMLLNNRLNNIILTVSDGIIVIDREGIIRQINPLAEQILAMTEQEILGRSIFDYLEKTTVIDDLLMTGKAYKDAELTINTQNLSAHCLSSGKPIKDDHGDVTGGAIFLNPINKVKNLVNRFSGAQASFHFQDIVGRSQQLQKAIDLATIAAGNNSNVLLQGESGTGKEVFAQSIHNLSARRHGPFLAVNCGAIPRDLIGSELFGYEGGSFTGAKPGGHPGKFELAAGGTLFLDEIGDMPLEHQVTLLRVLQDHRITRIGGDKTIIVDVRIICASNKNLQLEVAKGNFRQDLFFRLNVINISLPPLRERREDIPVLFNTFLKELCQKTGNDLPTVDPRLISYLNQYDWPGNVREFQNVVERMINVANGKNIGPEHLPEEIIDPRIRHVLPENKPTADLKAISSEKIKIKELLDNNERREIVNRLMANNGNISSVAREMGISRNSLYKKLKRLNIALK
ncbi:MAG TPA: sigma-54-dependent Fis family transcriptional regulator [Desulfobacteria bacterium]|nr:sigma-54-dependent Fis family transcriptional regulator [Desulfobacteria bacterium]